jgi:hypothetical protein
MLGSKDIIRNTYILIFKYTTLIMNVFQNHVVNI